MPAPLSVLTIAAGREAHLASLIEGLSRQSVPPAELVVARMQAQPFRALPQAPFPVRQLNVPTSASGLPLAAARNAAAAAAYCDRLVFLDVDCIPSPTLVEHYARGLAADRDAILMGELLYLPRGAVHPGWTPAALDEVALRHPDRAGPPAGSAGGCGDYRCFWSLTFALTRYTFAYVGGFDERYVGYGGEDTDFAKTASAAGVPLVWLRGARAWHQYHPHHMPPVHHLDSVVRNAELFHAKWGYRTMEHWLYAFRLMGLVADTPGGIRILRRPTPEDHALTGQDDGRPFVLTSDVIGLLRERVGEAAIPGAPAPVLDARSAMKMLLRPPAAAALA